MKLRAILLAIAAAAPSARAMDLLDAWRAAARHDPEIAAARAARAAGAAQSREASALWRPTIGLEAGAARASNETTVRGARFAAPGFGSSTGVDFDTSVTEGTSTRYAFVLRQPVYNAERAAQSRQLRIAAGASDVGWRAAEQSLIVRSTQRYLDAALAEQQVRVLQEQEAAVLQAETEAKDRFRIGDKPVTEVHEATARAQALKAQRLAAQSELELKRAQLADLTGTPVAPGLMLPTGSASDPGELASWLARAEAANPQLLQARAHWRSAEEEVRKTASVVSPTLDIVAQAGRDRITGRGDFGDASQSATQRSIGVQLSVPLYTGGWRSAKHDESVALAGKARAEAESARLQVAQQTRAAWLDLSVGLRRIEALEAGLTASLARLDATRTGVRAGDRTTLDLLNAQNDAAAAELALLQARAQQLTNRLRLAALAGELGETELAEANRELSAPGPRPAH